MYSGPPTPVFLKYYIAVETKCTVTINKNKSERLLLHMLHLSDMQLLIFLYTKTESHSIFLNQQK
jgi:hypothetical protein